jgi:hypothetical protein
MRIVFLIPLDQVVTYNRLILIIKKLSHNAFHEALPHGFRASELNN